MMHIQVVCFNCSQSGGMEICWRWRDRQQKPQKVYKKQNQQQKQQQHGNQEHKHQQQKQQHGIKKQKHQRKLQKTEFPRVRVQQHQLRSDIPWFQNNQHNFFKPLWVHDLSVTLTNYNMLIDIGAFHCIFMWLFVFIVLILFWNIHIF